MKPPSSLGIKLSKNAETAILNALNINADYRTRSAGEFIAELIAADEVKRKKEKKPKKPGALPAWVYAALAALLGGGVLFAVLMLTLRGGALPIINKTGSSLVAVPNFVGMTEEEAKAKYGDWSFVLNGNAKSDEVEIGCIMAQDPAYGNYVPNGTSISVTINGGSQSGSITKTMPLLRGASLEEAKTKLEGHEIEVIEQYDDVTASGLIIKTDPAYGMDLADDQKITLTVSRGGMLKDIEPINADEEGVITVNCEEGPFNVSDFYRFEPANVVSDKVTVTLYTAEHNEHAELTEDGMLVFYPDTFYNSWAQKITVTASMLNEDTGENTEIQEIIRICGKKMNAEEAAPTPVRVTPTPKPMSSTRPSAKPSTKPSNSPSPTPTATPKPSNSPSPKPTAMPTPTARPPRITPTPTSTMMPTQTPTPTPKPTPLPSPTPTETERPRLTPVPTPNHLP